MFVKLQNKLVEFLTAIIKKNFYHYPPPSKKFFYGFLDALGTSKPFFKFLSVTQVCKKKSVKR